ncbi:MAG: hypothetical protein IJ618_03310 [Prevotella sp.]|nr:hypothetical protein [Prevotella sp.]
MNKVFATLSADIVDSTSLSAEDTVKLKEALESFFPVMKSFCDDAWGRVVRGDSVECVIPDVAQSLRIALLLKCYVKTLELDTASSAMKKKGIRVVIGLGSLRINDRNNGIIDGEAIYNSGRELDRLSGSDGITLSLVSSEMDVGGFSALCDVLGFVVTRATGKQCQVLYHLLLGETQMHIAKLLGLEQPTVNQHAAAVGWNAIQRALTKYESENISLKE